MWQARKLTNAELLGVSCDICMQVGHDDLSSVKFRESITYCFTPWISKLQGSFQIDCVRQYQAYLTVLLGIVNAIFTGLRHWQIALIFNFDI